MICKYGHMSRRFRKFAAVITAGVLGVFVLSSCAPIDPVIASEAGYALIAPVGPVGTVGASFLVPKLTCAHGENSSARIWAGVDGLIFAPNSGANAKAGLILACKNGTATYTPYYGIYLRGKNSPDQYFYLFGIKPGDRVGVEVAMGYPFRGQVKFTELINGGDMPATNAQATAIAPQIQGASSECFVEAPRDPAQFARFSTITIDSCGNGLLRINEQPGSKALSVVTKSGKALTQTVNSGPLGYFSPFSIRRI